MIIDRATYLAHYGVLRRSGRYPWGSGGTQSERNQTFLDMVEDLRKQGLTEAQIVEGLGLKSTSQLRAVKSIAINEQKQARIAEAQKLKDKGLSNVAIGEKMGINESSVRSLLDPGQKERADILKTTSDMLKRQVDEKKFIDIGEGVENQLGISNTKLKTAVEVLKEQGYEVHKVQVDQMMGRNQKTTIKVLAPPGTTYRDVVANKNNIRQISEFSDDGGRSMIKTQPPLSIDSKRVAINYKEDGGDKSDGVIYVRPGVEDVSIGNSRYAQVRIAVDDTHYLKGMAVYKDDLPPGVDLVFNTNKSNTGDKKDAMKSLKDDEENPFGSIVRQKIAVGPDGKERVTSVMNIVGMKEGAGEEGAWDRWSRNLSSQFLSKQSPKLAQQQLDQTYVNKKADLDEIRSLTNPTVRKMLLEKFADGADSSAVHLRAAALPRQATKVLMPINSLKDTEVYAPSFKQGEQVALIRYPHGGTFEIPVLTVNHGNKEARSLLGKDPQDAIGINAKVAQRLSGADFDGDTVVVIPNNSALIKSTPALKDLQNFDPQRLYKLPPESPRMSSRTKQMQMGVVSNLITDMTIKGASPEELARAVKHSMVVIDAEKHHLDYRRSAADNGIRALQNKYQPRPAGQPSGGSSTLISRAKSPIDVPDRALRKAKDGGPIDPKTGKRVFEKDPPSFVTRDGRTVVKTRKSTKLAETDDASTLSSGTPMETVYANHSNRMKGLANEARKEFVNTKDNPYSPVAKKTYANEVDSLNAKLNVARRNKPLERQAQVFAGAQVELKKQANPNMDQAELKKVRTQALAAARARTQAQKNLIVPTQKEWEAIQAGAISTNQLTQILKSADLEAIRGLAMPRSTPLMSSAKTAQAQRLAANGYTQQQIAEALGVSLSTLKQTLNQ